MPMGLVINCILLMLSAVVWVLGISFYLNNRNTSDRIRHYVLFLSIFAGIWCVSYGAIGITADIHRAENYRILGVFSINAFLITEVFLFTGLSRMKTSISHILRTIVVAAGIADFAMYSNRKVDLFIRMGNWTTWKQNPDYSRAISFHSAFILLYFLILVGTGLVWAKRNRLRRQKQFVRLVFISNFSMIFFSLPDTFLPMAGYHPIATSGIGAAACAIVTWYGASQLNSFNIRVGNISRMVFDFMEVGAVVFDTEKKIALANPYAERCTSEETLEGLGIDSLFKVKDPETIFDRALNDTYSVKVMGNNNDRMFSISISSARDIYGDPYCFLCVFMDVTVEARAFMDLEVANNAKTDFLTSISHEIRTPINSIIGFDEMIIRDSNEDIIRSYASDADRAGRQLLSIINDLLDMGQITSGKMKIVTEKYDLGVLLHDIRDIQSFRAEEKDLKFVVYVNESTPRYLFGDEVRIQQIITNFVTNAVKYTNEGSVRLIVDHKVIDEENIELIVKIKDTGIGIREENIPHLYDAFSRFDKEAHKYIEGTGVGLSVAKSLIDLMEGTVEVESKYGEGTIFTVAIPQRTAGEEAIGNLDSYRVKDIRSEKTSFRAPNASILMVDDNKMNRIVFRGQLKPILSDLDEASGGKDMLELIREKKYDIIFLDHMMPEMDGIEALHRMKADDTHMNTDTPVIAMTANAGVDAKKMYLSEGFTDYIGKPVKSNVILKAIEQYLPDDLKEYDFDEEDEKEVVSLPGPEITLPEVFGIDWKSAREKSPDEKTLMDLIDKFCALAPDDLKELSGFHEAAGSGDKEALLNYRIKVHSLKNSAALIGADTLSLRAKELEEAAGAEDTEFINNNHAGFIREYEELTDRVRILVLKKESPEKKLMDNKTLSGYIETLKSAMADLDMVKLNDTVFLLSGHVFENEEISAIMEEVYESVRDYDTERFDSLVSEIRL